MMELSPLLIGIIGLAILLIFICSGIPIAYVFGLIGFVGLAILVGTKPAISLMGTVTYSQVANYTWTMLPLFILMGGFAADSGMTADAFAAARMWLGRFPGGLAIAVVVASTIFGAVSGSGIATTVTMTKVAWPEMKRYNYAPSLALGCCITGGCIDNLIPPSIILVMYAMIADESIGALFMGAIFPGLLAGGLMILSIITICVIKPSMAPAGPPSTWKEKFRSLTGVWAILILIVFVLGGIWLGVNTPNEAAGVGAAGAFVIGISRGTLKWKQTWQSLMDVAIMTGAIFVLFVGVQVFNSFISITNMPQELAEWVTTLKVPPNGVLGIILLIYFILGIPLELAPLLMLTLPIFVPLVEACGISKVLFGIATTVVVGIATITPPVGTPMFIAHNMVKKDGIALNTIFKGCWIFCIPLVIALILIVFFPQIALWLPSTMR